MRGLFYTFGNILLHKARRRVRFVGRTLGQGCEAWSLVAAMFFSAVTIRHAIARRTALGCGPSSCHYGSHSPVIGAVHYGLIRGVAGRRVGGTVPLISGRRDCPEPLAVYSNYHSSTRSHRWAWRVLSIT